MYKALQNDLEKIDELLSLTKDKALQYLNALNTMPTSNLSRVSKDSAELTSEGAGLLKTMEQFYNLYEDKMIAAAGPRYWGYVVGGTTPAAIAGDWLGTVFDQNPQGISGHGDLSALVELQAINWMKQLFGLPDTFAGGFVSGATMANYTCLATGRQWAGMQKGNDIAREGIKTTIKVLSATPHSSSIKSLSMLGMGSANIVSVKTLPGNREAMDIEDLKVKIIENQDFPLIVISSAATVNTADFDDFAAIAELQRQFPFYWHIDAAFGGFASCSPNYKHLLNDWGFADSITTDCHKWMNVPYDSAVYFVNKKHTNLQMATFQNSNAPYLEDPAVSFNYLNFGPENSRRLRALPAWFSLYAYGKNGFASIVENSIHLAQLFAEMLVQQTGFELAAPVRLNIVCFTTKNKTDQQHFINEVWIKLNQSGKLFITPTVYKGQPCLRAAFVNWRTTEEDVQIAIDELLKCAQ